MSEHIYFIGAHPDDLIGSAGSAFLAKEHGFVVHVIDLTRGERGLMWTKPPTDMETCSRMRLEEERHACALLGVEPVYLDEIDGEAHAGAEAVKKLADIFRREPPRAVFTHWPVDCHVDHVMCFAVVRGAMREASCEPEVYGFEESIQTRSMPVAYYVPFGQEVMDRKLALCRCYVCQNVNDRMATRKLAEAQYNGWKCGRPFAECFGTCQIPLPGAPCVRDELVK